MSKFLDFIPSTSEVESKLVSIITDNMRQTEQTLRCSFCGKPHTEVRKLLAAPKAYICNDCVDLCVTLLANSARREGIGLDELLPGSYGDRPWPTPGLY